MIWVEWATHPPRSPDDLEEVDLNDSPCRPPIRVRQHLRRTYDVLIFDHELEMLEVRLHELSPVVDRFVIVESPWTHSGKTKPLHFLNNLQQFEPFLSQIDHVIVDDMPHNIDGDDLRWKYPERPADVRRVFRQREAAWLSPTLWKTAREEDLVIISDIDEIPRRDTVGIFRYCLPPNKDIPEWRSPTVVYSHFHYYSLKWEWYMNETIDWWRWGPTLTTFRDLMGHSPHLGIDATRWQYPPMEFGFLKHAGWAWHFSFFGSPDTILHKLRNTAASRFHDYEGVNETVITSALREGRDVLQRSRCAPLHVYQCLESAPPVSPYPHNRQCGSR